MICPDHLFTPLELKCNLYCIPTRVATSNYSKMFTIIRSNLRSLEMNSSHSKTVFTVLALRPLHKFHQNISFVFVFSRSPSLILSDQLRSQVSILHGFNKLTKNKWMGSLFQIYFEVIMIVELGNENHLNVL